MCIYLFMCMYCVCVCVCTRDIVGSLVEVEDKLEGGSFLQLCGSQAWVIRLIGKHLYLLSCFVRPPPQILVCSRTGIGKRYMALVFLVQSELLTDVSIRMEDNPEASAFLFHPFLCRILMLSLSSQQFFQLPDAQCLLIYSGL